MTLCKQTKRKFALALSAVLLSSCLMSVMPVNSVAQEGSCRSLLCKSGLSDTEIDSLPLDVPQLLSDYLYAGSRIMEKKTDGDRITEIVLVTPADKVSKINDYSLTNAPSEVRSYGAPSLSVSVYNHSTSGNICTKRINVSFSWSADPSVTNTDKLGIAYNDSWTVDTSQGGLVYQCYGANTGDLYSFFYYDGQTVSGVGIKYNTISLKSSYNGEPVTNHSGWANLYIKHSINQTGQSKTTCVKAAFFHKVSGSNGTITLSSIPEVTISNSSNYSSTNKSIYFSWTA